MATEAHTKNSCTIIGKTILSLSFRGFSDYVPGLVAALNNADAYDDYHKTVNVITTYVMDIHKQESLKINA